MGSNKKTVYGRMLPIIFEMKSGESFYIETESRNVTSFCSTRGLSATPQECILIDGKAKNPIAKRIIKVTKV